MVLNCGHNGTLRYQFIDIYVKLHSRDFVKGPSMMNMNQEALNRDTFPTKSIPVPHLGRET